MGNVYSAGNDKSLILYNSGNNIYLRSAIGENIGRPVTLGNNFKESLSDTIYHGTIYYCYISTENDIIIKSITDQNILYSLKNSDSPDYYKPRIFTFNKILFLTYIIRNPLDDTYSVKCICPFNNSVCITLTDSYEDIPEINMIITDTNLFLSCHQSKFQQLYQIDGNFHIQQFAAESKIQEKYHAFYQKEISMRDSVIENIKKQYNDLMITATKYRDEAIKWHNKFYSDET